jgi:hypothetical protein
VCDRDFLNISCSAEQVILIESAWYGRMKVGRCVRQSLGYIDCRIDALSYVERWCSGRQRCVQRVPDDELHDTKPCPTDTVSYLETTYRCIRGNLPLSIVLLSSGAYSECVRDSTVVVLKMYRLVFGMLPTFSFLIYRMYTFASKQLRRRGCYICSFREDGSTAAFRADVASSKRSSCRNECDVRSIRSLDHTQSPVMSSDRCQAYMRH